jgi:5'-nucleotidase
MRQQQKQQQQVLLFLLCLLSSAPLVTSLRILLTNNNGFTDLGMPLLRDALVTAGHDVHVFAPTKRIDGASVALDLPFVNVTQESAQTWLIDGFAATSVLVGMSQMRSTKSGGPDLVISGINDGYSSGSQDLYSGTLGGALTGLSWGIPSLAIFTDSPEVVTESYLANVAQFVVQLVDTLDDVFSEFPPGVGLKVVYPQNEAPESIPGVVLAGNNNYFFLTYEYVLSETVPNQLEANLVFLNPPDTLDTTSDAVLVQEGFITALPIKADISVQASRFNENFLGGLAVLLETIKP